MSEDGVDVSPGVWRDVIATLAPDLTKAQRTWLDMTQPIGRVSNTVLLAAPSELVRESIERQLREPVTTALSERMQASV
ncbi:MAG TPA: hypothetical protein VFM01_08680, partial [Nakamurella sp.]|nr:hypothetical protein [Nakamurella sp.]